MLGVRHLKVNYEKYLQFTKWKFWEYLIVEFGDPISIFKYNLQIENASSFDKTS